MPRDGHVGANQWRAPNANMWHFYIAPGRTDRARQVKLIARQADLCFRALIATTRFC
nr:hypothetical protein [Candidatus Sigynarchaeota archaeon]